MRDEVHTQNGLAPGSWFAMWDLYVYLLEAAVNFTSRLPFIGL